MSADDEEQEEEEVDGKEAAGEAGGAHRPPHPELGSQTAGSSMPGAADVKQAER